MKTIIAVSLMILSFVAQSTEVLPATQALNSILRLKTYYGKTLEGGNDCKISLRMQEEGIYILAEADEKSVERWVKHDGAYRWQPGVRYFLSSEIKRLRGNEKNVYTFMTRAMTESTQYMVVDISEHRDRDIIRNTIECEINL